MSRPARAGPTDGQRRVRSGTPVRLWSVSVVDIAANPRVLRGLPRSARTGGAGGGDHPRDPTGPEGDPLARGAGLVDVDVHLAPIRVAVLPAPGGVLLGEQPGNGGVEPGIAASTRLADRLHHLEHVGDVPAREGELEPRGVRAGVAPAHRVHGGRGVHREQELDALGEGVRDRRGAADAAGTRARARTALTAPQPQGRPWFTPQRKPGPGVMAYHRRVTLAGDRPGFPGERLLDPLVVETAEPDQRPQEIAVQAVRDTRRRRRGPGPAEKLKPPLDAWACRSTYRIPGRSSDRLRRPRAGRGR